MHLVNFVPALWLNPARGAGEVVEAGVATSYP